MIGHRRCRPTGRYRRKQYLEVADIDNFIVTISINVDPSTPYAVNEPIKPTYLMHNISGPQKPRSPLQQQKTNNTIPHNRNFSCIYFPLVIMVRARGSCVVSIRPALALAPHAPPLPRVYFLAARYSATPPPRLALCSFPFDDHKLTSVFLVIWIMIC